MKKADTNRKIVGGLIITFFIVAMLLLGAYVGLARYYEGGFSYGTWINGIYCTGKTVEEVNEELLKECNYPGLRVLDKEGYSYKIKGDDIGFSFDFTEALHIYLNKQNPYLWVISSKEQTLVPVVSYEEERLEEILANLSLFADTLSDGEREVYLLRTPRGYELANERIDVLNQDSAEEAIKGALNHFEDEVDLRTEGCYEDLPLDEEMKETISLWEKIEEFQDCRIIYQFGEEQVPIDGAVVCNWIARGEDGSFLYDEEGNLAVDDSKIEEFIEKLADEYDTVGGIRHFEATRGEMVAVEGGIYGNKLNRKAEKVYLKKAFREKEKGIHTPEYMQKGWKQGKDDIGSTYIEIDMKEQEMYYYKNGRLELQTQVVTGNTGRRMGTPEGVNYVYGKQENRILRGPGYASHVNFWMPVKGNIGIHDASWRSEYGGEIYQTNGSHGCINTPYEEMSRFYEMVEVGTPVVMFY